MNTTTREFYDAWHKKNEELREKFNIPDGMGQKWECLPDCNSGCYRGCDRRCYTCYIHHHIYPWDFEKIQKQ